MKVLIVIASFLLSNVILAQTLGAIKKDTSQKNILIIFFGESNAEGWANNSDATALELSSRARLQLWNNSNDTGFYNVHIPFNSSVAQPGYTDGDGSHHGWELELANQVYANAFSNTDTVYLVKSSRGAVGISIFADGGFYWTAWKRRVSGAISKLNAKGKPLYVYIMFSEGINDSGTNMNTWYTGMVELITRTRTQVPNVPIYMTYIPATNFSRIEVNQKIKLLAQNIQNVYAITTNDVGAPPDGMHWTYSGMKKICRRMLAYITADYNSR